MDEGSEFFDGSGENSGGLLLSVKSSSLLSGGLIEPGLDEPSPVLSEVSVGKLIIVLNHLAN